MQRLVFFGSDEIALPALEHIVSRFGSEVELVAVFSQPDRPSGRGQLLHSNAVVAWARARGVAVFQPEKLDVSTPALLREELRCDLGLVMAYGHILKSELLAVPALGFYNLHASLLPKFRGAAPIEGAIASVEAQSGVCLQRIVQRLDAGPLAGAEPVPLALDETRAGLRQRIAQACVPLLDRILPGILDGSVQCVPQDEARVSFTRKITREDSALDFHATAREIAARVRALVPWPGASFSFAGLTLKIGAAQAEAAEGIAGYTPGCVLSADEAGLCLATGSGVLRVLLLQRPSGKMLPAGAFLRGFPMPVGTVLESVPMRPLARASVV
ncbi:MAG: methionyl-tRNA formyltransferase [Puniceicoccales bacterium]|nr:methionyl-tRNA formyltransferase [Puniceicoccales bacterium]